MIKLFKKTRQNLINEGKTSKYLKYAIGEIILVVIGILIALQINNWNQNRLNDTKEQFTLSSINKEFKENRVQLDTVLFYHKNAYASTKKLISMFPISIERDNLDSISKYLGESLSAWTFNPSQGSVNSIINSSSLDLIHNDELRDILVSWQDLVIDFQEDETTSKNTIINQIDPFLAQHLDYNFNFTDKRNNLKILESLEFEYLINIKLATLFSILDKGSELKELEHNLNRIIELTKAKK
jgi:hypothetical protein